MTFSLAPATRPLQGRVTLPGDKSLAHRAALFAALAEGTSTVRNYPDSGVTRAMRGALESLGVPSQLANGELTLAGNGLRPFPHDGAVHGGTACPRTEIDRDPLSAAVFPRASRHGVVQSRKGGRFRSRPMDDIVAEAKDLEALGVRELNLIAQDTTRYGLDLYGRYALAELVKRISAETRNIRWIRLLYCYPDKITDELIDVIKNDPKVVKYIDIPIQHISDPVLKRMNRHGDGSLIRETVRRLRGAVPDIVLRTTVMVGFPGETEADFNELCEFIKSTRFERLGAFTFSCEEDTPAAQFDDDVPAQVKQDRYDTVMSLQMNVTAERNRKQIGRTVEVLCEDYDPAAGVYYGRSAADAPDIDTKIYFSAKTKKRIRPGTFVGVKITEAVDYDLTGEAEINA